MVLTTHAVVGGAIGRLVLGHPILAFILAFASHFLLDVIPHWDYPLTSQIKDGRETLAPRFRSGWPLVIDVGKVLIDLAIGVALALFIFPSTEGVITSAVFWGAAGAVLPDFLQFVYSRWEPRILQGLQRFHHFIHAKKTLNQRPVLGIALQVLVMAVAVVIVKVLVAAGSGSILLALLSSFNLTDLLDILIVAVMIYLALIFIRRTKSFFIVNSVIFLFVIYTLAKYFDLSLTRQAFQPILTFFIVLFVIVFQREIRRFFDWLSFSGRWSRTASASTDTLSLLARAALELSRKKIGAIIIIPGESPVERAIEGGYGLDGRISLPLLLSIFDPTSPGHDGAIIVDGERVRRFGVHLPLAETISASGDFGTRHRAAVGISERTDALAIVISEERGTISVAENGELTVLTDANALLERLKRFVAENEPDTNENIWHFLLVKNFWIKFSAFILAAVLWFYLVFQIGVITQAVPVPLEFRFVPAGMTVVNQSTNTVTVTVSGRNRDLLSFKPEELKVSVDLSQEKAGFHEQLLSAADIDLPPYLTLVRIVPQYINFELKSSARN